MSFVYHDIQHNHEDLPSGSINLGSNTFAFCLLTLFSELFYSPKLTLTGYFAYCSTMWDSAMWLNIKQWNEFSSVQSLSHVWFFVNPWTAACQASLFITNSWNLFKLMFIELVMPSNHLIHCHPLLFPPSIISSIQVFSSESVLCISWPKYWSITLLAFDLLCFVLQDQICPLLQVSLDFLLLHSSPL